MASKRRSYLDRSEPKVKEVALERSVRPTLIAATFACLEAQPGDCWRIHRARPLNVQ